MQKVTVKAPCKINIGLNVINKRTDGYHNIETLFYPINLFDVITFTPADRLSFSTDSPELAKENDNLILKAVSLFEKYTKQEVKLNIHLEKVIPTGAGLGGGSSDAAATLKTLDKFYNSNLSENELLELAFRLGSDAPFFIKNKPCLASSRGEVLQEVNYYISYPILLVNPQLHISTKWAYENVKPKLVKKSLSEYVAENLDMNYYKHSIYNDFEGAIFSKFHEIKKIKERMYAAGAMFSLMTGSGSTVFGIFADLASAEKVKDYFLEADYFTFINKP